MRLHVRCRGRRRGSGGPRFRPLRHPVSLLLLAGTLTLPACAPRSAPAAPAPVRTLAMIIDSIVDAPPLHRTHWGIAVRDLASGEMIYARNAERHFIPASNTKLVVTLVALGELGPDWRFRTEIRALDYSREEAGTLFVRGTGDPTLSERFGATSEIAVLDSLAAQVAAAGVRRVTGDIVIDATRFTDERVNSTWEVGDLPYAYATPTGAFAVADGTFRVIRRPGERAGDPAAVDVLGGSDVQPLVARVATDTLGARVRWDLDYLDRRDTVFIAGAVPVGRGTDTLRLAVADADAYAGRALRAALRRAGVTVDGTVRVVRDTTHLPDAAAGHVVAWRESPPLRDIVAAILKPSQNWIAEQMLKTLGAERGEGGSWSDGLEVEEQYLTQRVGIDSLAVNLRDASGLSAQNLLTPAAILAMLEHAHRAPWAADYREALPSPGEEGGTLASRLDGLETRIDAKTGTIANVNSLSGYLRAEDGRDLVFSIMTNGSGLPSAPVRNAIDAVAHAIATSRRSP